MSESTAKAGVDSRREGTRGRLRRNGDELHRRLDAIAPSDHRESAGLRLPQEYAHKLKEATEAHNLPPGGRVIFLEVYPGDVSDFSDVLKVQGRDVAGHQVFSMQSPAVPNAIAAVLMNLRDRTGTPPHAYFGWTEGNPVTYLLRFLAFGEGDTAPVAREVLRQAEADASRRPRIHVG